MFIDDSAFFQHLISPLLSTVGYDVVSVSSASEALSLKMRGETFDLILSDIEMPEMTGLELVEQLKSDERWGTTPKIALSSRADMSDIERSRDAGFDEHISKSDRDRLLSVLSEALRKEEDAA